MLINAFKLSFPSIVSVAGAGGKTSLIFALAKEAAAKGRSVLITTTTAMFNPDVFGAGPEGKKSFHRLYTGPADSPEGLVPEKGKILIAARDLAAGGKKLKGYPPDELGPALETRRFDLVLIEADGARMRPVKAPAGHEPVILPGTLILAGCIGLDCLDKPLSEPHVHRPEHLAQLSGQPLESPVTETTLAALISHENGLFKSTPPGAKKILILNKADSEKEKARAQKLIQRLSQPPDICLVTRLKDA